jgi:hypothetical protein
MAGSKRNARTHRSSGPRKCFAKSHGSLPSRPDRAVLVLFTAACTRERVSFCGRAEHVTSGRSADFANEAQLFVFLRSVLEDV